MPGRAEQISNIEHEGGSYLRWALAYRPRARVRLTIIFPRVLKLSINDASMAGGDPAMELLAFASKLPIVWPGSAGVVAFAQGAR